MVAAFSLAVVWAEDALAPRAHAMSLFVGRSFAVSLGYLFWGVSVLTELFLPPSSEAAIASSIGCTASRF